MGTGVSGWAVVSSTVGPTVGGGEKSGVGSKVIDSVVGGDVSVAGEMVGIATGVNVGAELLDCVVGASVPRVGEKEGFHVGRDALGAAVPTGSEVGIEFVTPLDGAAVVGAGIAVTFSDRGMAGSP